MKKFVWKDSVKYEEVLRGVKEKSSILSTIKRKLSGLVTSCAGTAL
jgi:hypothetical protein